MVPQVLTPTDRLMTGRTNRRRFLAGLAAVGLAPPAAVAAATNANPTNVQGEANVAQRSAETVATDYLTVPGARLYYEVSGSGPVLLLIPGGPVDAEGWAPIVGLLEENYTLVRYDPRGISRSRLESPEDVPVAVHADDAGRLLSAIGDEPAYVLGSSGGAVIGLALVERHSGLVQTLVAHEPPLIEFLPEGSEHRKAFQANQEIYDTYLKEGVGPAMEKFMAVAGLDEPPGDLSPEEQEAMAQQMARVGQNLDFFLGHYLLPIATYVPDVAALQAASSRVVVGVGEETGGQEAHETALALAARLGTEAEPFPGDHVGFMTQPEAFAEKLHEVFRGR